MNTLLSLPYSILILKNIKIWQWNDKFIGNSNLLSYIIVKNGNIINIGNTNEKDDKNLLKLLFLYEINHIKEKNLLNENDININFNHFYEINDFSTDIINQFYQKLETLLTSSDSSITSNLSISIVDGKENLLLPGLMDSHIHVEMIGECSFFVNLQDCSSIFELQETVRKYVEDMKKDQENQLQLPFIIGFNWDQHKLGKMPTRHDLDIIETDLPVS